jgi:hypothetical protein
VNPETCGGTHATERAHGMQLVAAQAGVDQESEISKLAVLP